MLFLIFILLDVLLTWFLFCLYSLRRIGLTGDCWWCKHGQIRVGLLPTPVQGQLSTDTGGYIEDLPRMWADRDVWWVIQESPCCRLALIMIYFAFFSSVIRVHTNLQPKIDDGRYTSQYCFNRSCLLKCFFMRMDLSYW